MITVATHDGFFHADGIFALAVISLWAKKARRNFVQNLRSKGMEKGLGGLSLSEREI